MKIFGFEIRKFKDEPENIESIETWVVSWGAVEYSKTLDRSFTHPKFLTFTQKEQALKYAEQLELARGLLGDVQPKPKVYMQKAPSNV